MCYINSIDSINNVYSLKSMYSVNSIYCIYLFHGVDGQIKTVVQRYREKPWETIRRQFPRTSPHTEGQQIDCSPRSHGISV